MSTVPTCNSPVRLRLPNPPRISFKLQSLVVIPLAKRGLDSSDFTKRSNIYLQPLHPPNIAFLGTLGKHG